MRRVVGDLALAFCLAVLVSGSSLSEASPSVRSFTADSSAPTVLFAGVASAPGGNNTQWRSEAVLTNGSDSTEDVLLELVPRGESGVVASLALTLSAGETRRIPDVYAALGVASGAGTLRVKGPVLSWVRTFNQGATGTFGQDVPPVGREPAFAAVTPVFFPINAPADPKTDFRSNLLLLNSGTTALTFTLSAGSASKTYDVPAGVFAQIGGIGAWLGLSPGPAILSVSANGGWSGMVSTIDPVLGDPTTVRGLVATTRTVAQFSGVASAGGANNTQWRSEATLFNPRTSSQNVTLELIPRDGASPIANVTLPLGPFQQVRIPDVYQRFSVPSGAGTLRVTGDVLTWVRTFNQGAGVTFGQDVPETVPGVGNGPTASVSFPVTTPADTKTDFRSNFIVYNHETRPVTLTFTAGGATGTLNIPAGTFTQKNNVGAWLGLRAGTSTMAVSGDGRWSGMVSTIDPFLGDPTTMIGIRTTGNPTPTAQGVPSGSASTATIGPAGGTLASADGRFSLTVPAGALAGTTTFTIEPVTNTAWSGIGAAYRLAPAGTTFAKPATLAFTAAAADTEHISPQGLTMGYQDGEGYWHWLSTAVTDPAARTVSAAITKISASGSALRASSPDGTIPAELAGLGTEPSCSYSLLSGVVLQPTDAFAQVNETVELRLNQCLPAKVSPHDPRPLEPFLFECDFFQTSLEAGNTWAVNGVTGGNATYGTIDGLWHYATFRAPGQAPNPRTVTVSVDVPQYGKYQNLRVLSHVTIGGCLQGYFAMLLRQKGASEVPMFEVGATASDVKLCPFQSDENGVAYDMTGTIEIDKSFIFNSFLTCSLAESAKKPIPADTVFSIRRKPSLGQHWAMPAVSWNFTCNPGPIPMLVSIQFFIAQPGACSQAVWLPLDDESRPNGRYTDTCNAAFSVEAGWSFYPK